MFATFKSSQPYLHLSYRNLFSDDRLDQAITFSDGEFHDQYTSRDPEEIQALREYVERTKDCYIIMELTKGCKVWEFLQNHIELEESLIREAEEKNEERIREQEEKERYSIIRSGL